MICCGLVDLCNEPKQKTVKTFRGTLQYASFDGHKMKCLSYKDDLESLILVLSEAVICVYAYHMDLTNKVWKKNACLPWSEAEPDVASFDKANVAVFEEKQKQLSNVESQFYSRMPEGACHVIKQCWDEVCTYSYRQVPDYSHLQNFLPNSKCTFQSLRAQMTKKMFLQMLPKKAHVKKPAPATPLKRTADLSMKLFRNYPFPLSEFWACD